MNAVQVLRSAFDGSHRWYQGTVDGLTEDQANRLPEGKTHPIGGQMAHVLQAEDSMIAMLQDQPPLWQSEGWGERLGLPYVFNQGADSERAFRCDPACLTEYGQAVYARTNAFLDGLSDADLDRPVDLTSWGIGIRSMGEVLTGMVIGNNFAHTGEISALKGLQGLRGYPF